MKAAAAPSPSPCRLGKAPVSDARSVLVVEDDPSIRGVLQAALTDEGLIVQTAGTGRAAIEHAQRGCPDLVLLDMMLPDTTGAAVAAQLKAQCGQGLRIVVITADGSGEAKAASVGAAGYLSKPFDVNRLVDLVLKLTSKAA